MITLLETRPDGVKLYEMKNDDLTVLVSSYGVTIVEIDAKDAKGEAANVVLGYPAIEDYMAKSGTYFGAVVGRVCNRLAKGNFVLNGKEYNVPINNGPNSLHGGIEGFSYKNFESSIEGNSLVFHYVSKDGEEGYPGELDLTVTLTLEGNKLHIAYDAVASEDTLCNLTHHTYFNLSGHQQDASSHRMQINADRHGLVDADGLCMGQYREVAGTPLDYRTMAPIEQGFDQSDWQVKNANGIDHHFVLNKDGSPDLVLEDPISGRVVTVLTSLPGVQVYSGNYIGDSEGRNNTRYGVHSGIAVEPQYVPDSIHNEQHPKALLKKGEHLQETIDYIFTANEVE